MSKHRGGRRQVGARRRARVMALALGVTLVAGATGAAVLPQLRSGSAPGARAAANDVVLPQATATPEVVAQGVPEADELTATVDEIETEVVDPAVPADSGEGRRIVFSEGDQRVWLVADDEQVERTYLVSGSRFDNLDPGTYAVQSKTREATAFDASGTMQYFVRFATGFSEPIGFHSVPRDNSGKLEQTRAQLGTPLSAGCVRQWKPDAIALWDFAPVGTTVVVTT